MVETGIDIVEYCTGMRDVYIRFVTTDRDVAANISNVIFNDYDPYRGPIVHWDWENFNEVPLLQTAPGLGPDLYVIDCWGDNYDIDGIFEVESHLLEDSDRPLYSISDLCLAMGVCAEVYEYDWKGMVVKAAWISDAGHVERHDGNCELLEQPDGTPVDWYDDINIHYGSDPHILWSWNEDQED